MKHLTLGLVVVSGVVGAVVGGMLGASFARSQAEASFATWDWLDASAVLANADGSPKDAQQQRDSINGNFVAQTYALPGHLNVLRDDALRSRLVERAKLLNAHPESVADTPLTMGRRDEALRILNCLAGLSEGESSIPCAAN